MLLVLFALVALFIPTRPLALDSRWSRLMQDIQTPAVKHVALVFNALGMGRWRILALVVVGVILVLARRPAALLAFAVSASLTLFGGDLIKAWVDRPRPPGRMLEPQGSSFPSSHAAYAAMAAVTLVLVFTELNRRRFLWSALAALAIAAMAWSRTYLQVHWFSDVVGGSLLGIGITLASFAAIQVFVGPAGRGSTHEPGSASDS